MVQIPFQVFGCLGGPLKSYQAPKGKDRLPVPSFFNCELLIFFGGVLRVLPKPDVF